MNSLVSSRLLYDSDMFDSDMFDMFDLTQKRWEIYVSQIEIGGKYWNVVVVPTCHFVPRYSYGNSQLLGSLGSNLTIRGQGSFTCFYCTIWMEDNTHRFINCPIVCDIWKYLSDVWQVLTRRYLRPHEWFFSHCLQNGSNDDVEILFQFLLY